MQGVFNPNILIYHPPNSAKFHEGLHFSAFHIICVLNVFPHTNFLYNIMSFWPAYWNCLFAVQFSSEKNNYYAPIIIITYAFNIGSAAHAVQRSLSCL